MRIMWYFLLTTFFIISNTIAQNSNLGYPRFGYQQQFVANNFLSGDQHAKIETTDQLDKFFNEIEQAWIKYVDDTVATAYNGKIPENVLYNIDSVSFPVFRAIQN